VNELSYQSSGVFPAKLMASRAWIVDGQLRPIHLQIYPTNQCNANCSFCSCKNRDRNQSIPWTFLKEEIHAFAELGGQAVTLTGGGEPLMYPSIEELINLLDTLGIKIGMATNGILLDRIQNIGKLTWCRISANDMRFSRDVIDKFDIDWAFSYVWDGNYEKVRELINFTNSKERVTHFRIVNDINNPDAIPKFGDDSKVLYQNREEFTQGAKCCLIGLVKPVLNADGFYYPCCGVQYATAAVKHMPVDMIIGKSIKDLLYSQKAFDGSVCKKCYYNNYNELFNIASSSSLRHKEFV
jgi:MoaA/NifB/PqqE/SkfB family radical SAM enzyme